jgi:hypothetical protein
MTVPPTTKVLRFSPRQYGETLLPCRSNLDLESFLSRALPWTLYIVRTCHFNQHTAVTGQLRQPSQLWNTEIRWANGGRDPAVCHVSLTFINAFALNGVGTCLGFVLLLARELQQIQRPCAFGAGSVPGQTLVDCSFVVTMALLGICRSYQQMYFSSYCAAWDAAAL